ncbi:unnamed protein product [Trichobilharzia szidati]|nr:unnamed protein product [Trichobilharzia szidati]
MTLCSDLMRSPRIGVMSGHSKKKFKQQQQMTINHAEKSDDTDSGYLSRATSVEKLSTESTHDTKSSSLSIESLQLSVDETYSDKQHQSQRRSSSGQKLVKLLNVFAPCRNRIARRSRSFGDINKTMKSNHKFNWKFSSCSSQLRVLPVPAPLVTSRTTLSIGRQNDISNESIPDTPFSPTTSFLTTSNCSYSTQLDILITEPNQDMYEFRRRWPSSFLALITNYLGFLVFTSDELDQIRDLLIKDSKQPNSHYYPTSSTSSGSENLDISCRLESNNNSNTSNTTGSKTQSTPRKMLSRLREQKQNTSKDNEIDHWYIVVNTILRFLLSNKHYKHRFIFRRPGNQSCVNDLEKALFNQQRPSSVSSSSSSSSQFPSFSSSVPTSTASTTFTSSTTSSVSLLKNNSVQYEVNNSTEVNDINKILLEHDPSVIACLLARVLRRQGIGLIPNPLRRLFIQLISGVKENEVHQRRAIRLLFLLCPIRLVNQIIKPLFELMANVANEPDCEVDETSLAVLFSPIFFLDRSTTTPIALANPLPIRVLDLCVRLAKEELKINSSVTKLFQIPILFLHDCTKNLVTHQTSNSPALCCSLKYCVTMTPSPRSQGKKLNESSVSKSDNSTMNTKPNSPRVNLTAAFLAKKPRANSPSTSSSDCVTPVVKNVSDFLNF